MAAVSTWSIPKGQVPKEGSRPGGADGRGGDARIGREAGRATSRATSRLRQSFRWRGPLSAAQSGPAPSLVGDQWAGHPSGPGTTEGQTAPPYCPGGDKGAKKKREGGREVEEPGVGTFTSWPGHDSLSLSNITPHSLAPNCPPKAVALQGTADTA